MKNTFQIGDQLTYDVNFEYGFLPFEIPLIKLPNSYYEPWENVITNLPDLLENNQIRLKISELPLLSTSYLKSKAEHQRAFLILSFLSHAYVWGKNGSIPAQTLPVNLALPWTELSIGLQLKPVVCASSVCSWNWKLIDETKEADLDNLKILHTFTGTKDESWFYVITTAIEALGGKALRCIVDISNAILINDCQLVAYELENLKKVLLKINSCLSRMSENCNPDVFYWKIRPYLSGWLNMKDQGLPNGLYYEGTSHLWEDRNCWRQFAGGSAGQTPLIQALDIALGVEHYPTSKEWIKMRHQKGHKPHLAYLTQMRDYMPGPHRRLLFDLSDLNPSINGYICNLDPRDDVCQSKTITLYNECVQCMKTFRDIHLQIVSRYIILPSKKGKKQKVVNTEHGIAKTLSENESATGTGGTDLIPFLKQCRDETEFTKIIQKL